MRQSLAQATREKGGRYGAVAGLLVFGDWLGVLSLALLTLVFSAGGFVLCGWDKRQARRHHRRIAEKTLFLIGLLMGAWG